MLKVKLVKSTIGCMKDQIATVAIWSFLQPIVLFTNLTFNIMHWPP